MDIRLGVIVPMDYRLLFVITSLLVKELDVLHERASSMSLEELGDNTGIQAYLPCLLEGVTLCSYQMEELEHFTCGDAQVEYAELMLTKETVYNKWRQLIEDIYAEEGKDSLNDILKDLNIKTDKDAS